MVPAGTTLRTQIERTLIEPGTVSERSFGYYVDTAFHAEQHEARRAWRRLTATAGGVPRRGAETSWVKSTKKVKKVDTLAAHALVAAEDGPQEALAQLSGRKKKAATPAASLSGEKQFLIISFLYSLAWFIVH